MSDEPTELGATNARFTFRTYKTYVAKLLLIAKAHDLRIGDEFSIGKALNMIIEKYNDSAERAKVGVKKKGAKR